jgi:hypothetical protein
MIGLVIFNFIAVGIRYIVSVPHADQLGLQRIEPSMDLFDPGCQYCSMSSLRRAAWLVASFDWPGSQEAIVRDMEGQSSEPYRPGGRP